MPRPPKHRPKRPTRSRVLRRDALRLLAFAGAIYVSILALPVGQVHEHACRAMSFVAGHAVPCGLQSLNVTIDTDHRPWLSIHMVPLRLPISL